MLMNLFRRVVAPIALVTALLAPQIGAAQDDFYRGKRIELYVGSDVGGAYDGYARLLARHIGKHLPGNPGAIVKNMPGAGGMRLANYMYTLARPDGTEIAILNQGAAMSQALNESGVQYDARRMNWIGSTHSTVNVAFAWHTAPVKTIQDAQKQELIVGTTGAGSATSFYPELMNQFLGTKFKVIGGYKGNNDMMVAIERGEVNGRGAYNWANLRDQTDWVRDKKVNILVQMGAERAPDLPDVPLMHELAKNDADREVLEFVSLSPALGRPFVAPPGVPAERVDALRAAFHAAITDPDFLAEATKQRLEIEEVSGKEVAEIIRSSFTLPPDVIKAAAEASEVRAGSGG
jgi:tripartite-type tricarboxylate transporter receptor subunit TctC